MSFIDLANIIIDPNDFDARIHFAALAGNMKLIVELLSKEPHLARLLDRQISPIGARPLRLAATGGHLDVIQFLLQHDAHVDGLDLKQQTPLFVAIKYKHLECARFLLENGANPNGAEQNRCTPLDIAIQEAHVQGVMLLLFHGADTEANARLQHTTSLPNLEGFLLKIQRRYQSASSNQPLDVTLVITPLLLAINTHQIDCFMCLLAAGAEVDLRRLLPELPHSTVQQLSLTHAMVKKNVDENFAVYFALFGGYLWQKDTNGNVAIDGVSSASCRKMLQSYMETPLKLKEQCRISVRRILGRKRLPEIRQLPLPKTIRDYLLYKDVIPECYLIYT